MTVNKLEVRHETPEEGIHIYALTGSLFGTTGGYAFVDEIREKSSSGAKGIIVDFSGVDRIDSCGIGIIVSTIWSASEAGCEMVLAAIPDRIERVLTMAMLLDHIGHADTVEAALETIKTGNAKAAE
jgi:anti-anti-sigma factor